MAAKHVAAAAEQIVRSSSDAPSLWKKRRSMLALQQAHRAGIAVGDDGLGVARRHLTQAKRSPDSAASHEMRSETPLPLAPTRRSGCSTRSGW